jgi:hypothetical protein
MKIDEPVARSDYKDIVRLENVQKHARCLYPSFGLQSS